MGLSWTPVRAVALYAILLAGVFVVVAALANIAQFGWLVTSEPIKPRIARISPAMGLRRLFSSRSIVRAVLSVAKIAGVSVVFVALLGKTAETARDLATQKLTVAASGLAGLAWGLSVRLLALLALLGLVDLLYQRRQYRNDLKITRRQLLEDLRRMEGNPRRAGRRHMQAEKLGRNAKQQEANED